MAAHPLQGWPGPEPEGGRSRKGQKTGQMWFSFSSVFRPFFVSPRERAPQPAEVRALEAAAIRSGDWVHLHHEIGLGEGGSVPAPRPLRE